MTHPIDTPSQSPSGWILPEFADHKTAKALFGLSRAYLYELVKQGKIRSVSLRKKGAIRGRRLFDCNSIRALLANNAS